MDPSKDLAAYGYGSVAWKDKVDSWKQRQEKMQMMMSEGGVLHPSDVDPNGPDLPMYGNIWLKFRLKQFGSCRRQLTLTLWFVAEWMNQGNHSPEKFP